MKISANKSIHQTAGSMAALTRQEKIERK